ncbi:OB-fold nucleic acid binding domain-containing protein [Colletotrichum graminicola]|uniref:OB-fold nucleic acid binding domain-containing protein n=1 Tax=Colletotrichum graminicola (strain M1.001 / M2 / FGSC 10212) TaxID=645133 RepID=E3QHD6_COLGM|nr:OB-fold nucleic acid binding domain-containing protein [Colletotrichum graminicola M1.001]EFQ30298.1 OB-fold nucleic acid binding domain-containing protein [Colletotrichum graminicola M1.001]WDK09009.1 OB-fold nucleic acid binding domain-containing protein [Colletotrichum graminicola]
MTSDRSAGLYPRYCLHLSPTFNTWCLLHASDIHALESVPEYEVQNFYFHKNLPIKWARIVGIVVAIDDFPGRRIYTVDDSSGACIECVVALKTPPPSDASAPKPDTRGWLSSNRPQPQPPADCVDVDVGSVVDVKGGLATFREEMQIRVEKVRILKSTEQEVALWERRTRFRNEVLLQPWVLSQKQIQKCKKEEMGGTTGDDNEEKRRAERKKVEEEMRQKADAMATTAKEDQYRAYKLRKESQRLPKPLLASAAMGSTVEDDRYRIHKLRRSGARSSDRRTGVPGGLLRQVLDDSIREKVDTLGR